jgi:peptidoglycan/LPS O-acetylase OafA/YrhL
MQPTSSSAQGRILALDGLRGTAILLVVVWHYFYFYPDPNRQENVTGVLDTVE